MSSRDKTEGKIFHFSSLTCSSLYLTQTRVSCFEKMKRDPLTVKPHCWGIPQCLQDKAVPGQTSRHWCGWHLLVSRGIHCSKCFGWLWSSPSILMVLNAPSLMVLSKPRIKEKVGISYLHSSQVTFWFSIHQKLWFEEEKPETST